jgi:hypothetical protein
MMPHHGGSTGLVQRVLHAYSRAFAHEQPERVSASSFLTFVLLILAAAPLRAAEYHCPAVKKYDFDCVYTPKQLDSAQFSTRLEALPEGSFLSRCSFSRSAGKVTCDRYRVDRVEFDRNAQVKKYYVFRSQFDFQLFSSLHSLESNGRGSVNVNSSRPKTSP